MTAARREGAIAPDKDSYAEAVSLAGAGRLAEALACVGRRLAAEPRHAGALALKAALLTETGDPQAALGVFGQAIALDPKNPTVHSNHGNALAKLKRPAEAVESYDRALALNPDYALALCNRAGQRLELKQDEAALADVDRALALNPQLAAAHRTRSRALLALARPAEALASIDAALALQPSSIDGRMQRGEVLTALGRYAEGVADFERGVALNPGDVDNHYRLGVARLRIGQFRDGWRECEHRWRTELFQNLSSAYPAHRLLPLLDIRSEAADIAGKSVLLVDEQGVGDQIMFASIIPDLIAAGCAVTCFCDGRMLSLLANSFPQVSFLVAGKGLPAPLESFDSVIALGGLGRIYRNEAADFPGTPYLRPREAAAAAWRERLGPKTRRLRVGLSWRGGTQMTLGAARSLTLDALRPLLIRDDCEFVSLQYGDAEAEVEAANAHLARPIRLFPRAEIDDFEQLAGLVASLDLVVSVQTALIHLSGAIGAPCLVMIPFLPEWRYGASGPDMPWYESVRLYRQAARGDWPPVIDAIAAELDRRAAKAANE